jgi:ribonuclease R
MQDQIDKELDAVISSVTSFGFFAKTENLCEGLVSIDDLGGGFYYDKDNYTLSRGKTSYRLGMKIKVRVDSVDIALRQINFSLIKEKKERENDENEAAKSPKSHRIVRDKSLAPQNKRKNRTRDVYHKRRR